MAEIKYEIKETVDTLLSRFTIYLAQFERRQIFGT